MGQSYDYTDRDFALVLVDMQKKFSEASDGLKGTSAASIDTVNRAIRLFRDHRRPVVYILFDGDPHSGHMEGGDDFTDGLLPPEEGEPLVHKTGMNSFKDSDLERALSEFGCDSLLIAGMVAQYCVIATYYGASDRGLMGYMLKGGLSSTDSEKIAAVECTCRTLTVEDMLLNKGFRDGSERCGRRNRGRCEGP